MNIKRLTRRSMLRAAGIGLSLPALEAMFPGRTCAASEVPASPKRLALICQELGVVHDTFFPEGETTRDYTMPKVLGVATKIRDRMTVFSNIDHDLRGGHHAAGGVFNGVKPELARNSPFGAITLDQRAAELIGPQCRFSDLRLWGRKGLSHSYSRQGTQLPTSAPNPSQMYNAMFVQGPDQQKAKARAMLCEGKSILDLVSSDAKRLSRDLGKTDREKLDQYFHSIRSVESQLSERDDWLDRPKPICPDPVLAKTISEGKADDLGLTGALEAWFDLMYLAMASDSTRVASLLIPINDGIWELPGVTTGAHALSHHGKEQRKMDQFRTIQSYMLSQYTKFVQRLAADRQADGSTLLDQTLVVYASGLSNGSTHSNTNLPVLVTGGTGKQGYHRNVHRKQPLNSLYLSLLQWIDPRVTEFNGVDRPLHGIELA